MILCQIIFIKLKKVLKSTPFFEVIVKKTILLKKSLHDCLEKFKCLAPKIKHFEKFVLIDRSIYNKSQKQKSHQSFPLMDFDTVAFIQAIFQPDINTLNNQEINVSSFVF